MFTLDIYQSNEAIVILVSASTLAVLLIVTIIVIVTGVAIIVSLRKNKIKQHEIEGEKEMDY